MANLSIPYRHAIRLGHRVTLTRFVIYRVLLARPILRKGVASMEMSATPLLCTGILMRQTNAVLVANLPAGAGVFPSK